MSCTCVTPSAPSVFAHVGYCMSIILILSARAGKLKL